MIDESLPDSPLVLDVITVDFPALEPATREALAHWRWFPGSFHVTNAAEALGVDAGVAGVHLERLADAGLLVRNTDGVRVLGGHTLDDAHAGRQA